MNYLDVVIDKIINNFDFAYMFIVNVLTYIIIKIILILVTKMGGFNYVNGDAKVPTWTKRSILLISIIIVTVIYVILDYDNKITLLNSAILAPVFWSWIMKPIFIKLGIGYKQIDDYMN